MPLSPGVQAAIVLGSIAGYLLIFLVVKIFFHRRPSVSRTLSEAHLSSTEAEKHLHCFSVPLDHGHVNEGERAVGDLVDSGSMQVKGIRDVRDVEDRGKQ
jgi:hypothetical protein